MSQANFIIAINQQIEQVFDKLTTKKLYGLAQSVIRLRGSVQEIMPALVDPLDEQAYVGIDDTVDAIVYHKNQVITTTQKPNSGVGDSTGDLVNIYQNAMLVYYDQAKLCLFPDELYNFIVANIRGFLQGFKSYKQVQVVVQSVNTNTLQLYNQEYAGSEFKLPANKILISISYQIQATYVSTCFKQCP